MDFKYHRKYVRRGSMTQKSYERWVLNDGADPEGEGKGKGKGKGFFGEEKEEKGIQGKI